MQIRLHNLGLYLTLGQLHSNFKNNHHKVFTDKNDTTIRSNTKSNPVVKNSFNSASSPINIPIVALITKDSFCEETSFRNPPTQTDTIP